MSAYGGVWAGKMFPSMPGGAQTMSYAGKNIRRAALNPTTSGGTTSLSEVLSAPSSVLTPSIVQKMSLLQGVDIPFDCNHHSAATFGCYAQGDGKMGKTGAKRTATVDQVIAQSNAFYPDLNGVTQRSVLMSHFGQLSYRSKVPGNPLSDVDLPPTYTSVDSLWTALFGGAKPSSSAPQRQSIVDLVYNDYVRLKTNPKLASADKARLEDHIARVADIKRRQSVTISCSSPTKPAVMKFDGCGSWQSQVDFYKTFQDVLVAALACGLTRSASFLHQGWSTTFGERCEDPWHQLVSHVVDMPDPQNSMSAAMQRQFSGLIAPLAAKLDSVKDANGKSLLDRSLMYWTQEHGVFSHCQENIPVVTIGSATGAFNTGYHMDYRDMNRIIPTGQFGDKGPQRSYVGLTWHQMLGSLVQGFGIPRTEWGQSNHGGFGVKPSDLASSSYGTRYNNWGAAEWNAAGDKLPWWLA